MRRRWIRCATPAQPDIGVISVYALGSDYHDVIKKRLKALARWLVAAAPGSELKVFVDTAPVMEKPLAAAAGLGWQGKHTNVVSRAHGSWLFLGALYTTLELPADSPHADRCGSCTRCQAACPTNAFPAPYQLDARRCISYLTIEHKGPVPEELRSLLGNRIYGCDDCLAVCPWNRFAQAARELAFQPRAELTAPALADLLALDDAGFRTVFSGSPIKRIGRDRMVRNCLYAAGNSGDAALAAGRRGAAERRRPCRGRRGPLGAGAAYAAGLRPFRHDGVEVEIVAVERDLAVLDFEDAGDRQFDPAAVEQVPVESFQNDRVALCDLAPDDQLVLDRRCEEGFQHSADAFGPADLAHRDIVVFASGSDILRGRCHSPSPPWHS